MIMTDQDHDGSHIKGLIMNFLHHFYPSLLRVKGFLLEFITPIVKVFCATLAVQKSPSDCTGIVTDIACSMLPVHVCNA